VNVSKSDFAAISFYLRHCLSQYAPLSVVIGAHNNYYCKIVIIIITNQLYICPL